MLSEPVDMQWADLTIYRCAGSHAILTAYCTEVWHAGSPDSYGSIMTTMRHGNASQTTDAALTQGIWQQQRIQFQHPGGGHTHSDDEQQQTAAIAK